MIIDIHTHAFPDKIAEKAVRKLQGNSHTAIFSDGTEAKLLEAERRAGVNLAVIQPVATYPEQVTSINNHVLQNFRDTVSQELLSFAAMHAAFDHWEEELERISASGIPGIKLHAPYAEVNMDDDRTIRILRKCRDLDLVVLIHGGWDVGLPGHAEAHPERIRRALDAIGKMKMVVAHMGGWKCWEEASSLLSDTGIYIDTAVSLGRLTPAGDAYPWTEEELQTLHNEAFCNMVHIFGYDHVLFGTDSPWADPSDELAKIRAMPLPQMKIDAICGENAMMLLGMQQPGREVNGKDMDAFCFRPIRPDEAEQAIRIETICFPPHEACKREHMIPRIAAAKEFFLVAEDRRNGEIAGFINGIATNERAFRDDFFTDAETHDPLGSNIMILGLDVLPEYRGKGLARELVKCYRNRFRGRRLVLTCLERLVPMYIKFGFRDLGESASVWGGEKWHEMDQE